MPKIQYYDDVKIIKKPFKKRFMMFLSFFCIVVVFTLCIVVSGVFSKALTVGNIVNKFVYGDSEIVVGEKFYHAVMLGEYDDYKEAEKVALGSSIQGASGYVWSEEKFYVVGNIYKSEEDANKVLENLKESNYNSFIKTIILPKIKIDLEELENKDVRKIERFIEFFDKCYDSLYSYSIDFDKSIINNLAVSSYISDLRGECKVIISELQNFVFKDNKLQTLQNAYIKLDELFNDAIIKTIDNSATNYILKNTIATTINIQFHLHQSFL